VNLSNGSGEYSEQDAIRDLQGLARRADLREIVTYKLVAERQENGIESMADAEHKIRVMFRNEDRVLESRFIYTVIAPEARYIADVSGIFEAEADVELTEALISEFISEIALMVVFPYLREAITSLASRLGAEVPLIGFIRRGELRFGPQQSVDTQQASKSSDSEVERQ